MPRNTAGARVAHDSDPCCMSDPTTFLLFCLGQQERLRIRSSWLSEPPRPARRPSRENLGKFSSSSDRLQNALFAGLSLWARQDSNLGPIDYEYVLAFAAVCGC